jgi:hypothetical protein
MAMEACNITQPKQKRRFRETFRKIGRGIAAGILVAGLMLGSGRARAEEKPKPSLGVSIGAGYSAFEKEARAFATLSGTIPLPLRLSLFASAGFAGAEGKAKVEETTLELSRAVGPLTLAAGGYTSAHLWTDRFSPYGTVAVRLPRAFIVSADYIYLVGLQDPHLVLLKAGKGLFDGKLDVFVKGGWTIPYGWSARAGVTFKPGGSPVSFTLDSVVMGSKGKAAFSDTVVSAKWSF